MPDGIPSPSPDFPQQIKNVTGQANVKIQNKNLAWNGWAEDFVSRINNRYQARLEVKDNKNCLRYGAAAGYGDYDNKYMFKIPFKPNTQYTFVFDLLAEINTGNIGIQYTDNTTTSLTNIPVNSWNKVILASVANKTIKYLRVQYNEGGCWMDLDTFMVLEGAYTAETIPDYVPHQEQNLPFTFAEGQFLADNEKLQDNGMLKKWKQVTFSGTTATLEDAKTNGAYFCNKKVSGNLVDKTLSFDEEVTDAIIQYELAEPEIIPYNETQASEYNAMKEAHTYKDVTYITSESDELPPELDIQYWKERGV